MYSLQNEGYNTLMLSLMLYKFWLYELLIYICYTSLSAWQALASPLLFMLLPPLCLLSVVLLRLTKHHLLGLTSFSLICVCAL
jgi:hypothetical protein